MKDKWRNLTKMNKITEEEIEAIEVWWGGSAAWHSDPHSVLLLLLPLSSL
jgi:hypothetical protein